MAKTKLKVSGLPQVKRLEEFDFSWPKGGLTENKFQELSSLLFLPRKEDVILTGPSGIGKTHLMIALTYKTCMTGYSAYYLSCIDLTEVLVRGAVRASTINRLKSKLQWMKKPHVLVIDEVGYENLNYEQATLFFQLINVRYEHGLIIIMTNKPFPNGEK